MNKKSIFKKLTALLLVLMMIGTSGLFTLISEVKADIKGPTIAYVTYTQNGTTKTVGYTSCSDMWDAACSYSSNSSCSNVTAKILMDWIPGSSNHHAFGTSSNFSTGSLKVPDGCTITLDLNGCVIDRGMTSTDDDDSKSDCRIFVLGKNSTLNLISSNTTKAHAGKLYKPDPANESTYRFWKSDSSGDIVYYGGIVTGAYNYGCGGAVYMNEGSTLNVNHVNIVGNMSDGNVFVSAQAGAIYMNKSCTLNVENSAIDYNYGYDQGGAIVASNEKCKITLDNSSLSYNSSNDYGGAVLLDGDYCLLSVSDSKVNYNRCQDHGGAVYIDNAHCTVSGNAKQMEEDDTTYTGTVFYGNQSYTEDGGAIYINGKNGSINGLTLDHNTADDNGGAISFNAAGGSVSYCNVINNSCGDNGGGIWYAANTATLSYSTVMYNTASDEFGGVANDKSTSTGNPVSLSGKVIIYNNKAGGKTSNLRVNPVSTGTDLTKHILIYGSPNKYSHIGLTVEGADNIKNARLSNEQGSYITSIYEFDNVDNSKYYVEWNCCGDNQMYIREGQATALSTTTVTPYDKTTVYSGAYGDTSDEATLTGNTYDLIQGVSTYACFTTSGSNDNMLFYYSDGYFDADPTVYNTHLATFGYVLATSAFNEASAEEYTYKYENVMQLMGDIGCEEIYVNDFYTVKPSTDSIGVAMGHKTVTYGGSEYTLIPIAVRGGGYESEWSSNVTLDTSGEAAGFSSAATQVVSEVNGYLKQHNLTADAQSGKVIFFVVGFSRAAATANITSKRLTDSFQTSKVFGYTYETPAGGVDSQASHIYYNIHNIINDDDIVPMVGPYEMGFTRYGVDHYVPGTDAGDTQTVKVHALINNDSNITVTKTIDNTVVSKMDNSSLYLSQRALMLQQLKLVDDNQLYNDEFDYFYTTSVTRLVEWGVFGADAMTTTNENTAYTIGDFERTLLNNIQHWAIYSRYDYATVHTLNGHTYPSIQTCARDLFPIVYSLDDDALAGLMQAFGGISDVIGLGTKWDLYTYVLGDWTNGDTKPAEKEDFIGELWNMLFVDELPNGDRLSNYFTSSQLTTLHNDFYTLVDVIFEILSEDYSTNCKNYDDYKLNFSDSWVTLPTAIHIGIRLIQAHIPEVVLAWLRSYDSYYTNPMAGIASTQVHMDSSNYKPDATSAYVVNSDGTETQIASSYSSYENVTLKLSNDANAGAAVLFTITATTDGTSRIIKYLGKNVTEGDELRYSDEIQLESLSDVYDTIYTITTKSYAYGTFSDTKTYTVIINKKIKTIAVNGINSSRVTYFGIPGKKISIKSTSYTDKTFWKWTLDDGVLPDDFDIYSSTPYFTVGDSDLTVTANYKPYVDQIIIKIKHPITYVTNPATTYSWEAYGNGELLGSSDDLGQLGITWANGDEAAAGGLQKGYIEFQQDATNGLFLKKNDTTIKVLAVDADGSVSSSGDLNVTSKYVTDVDGKSVTPRFAINFNAYANSPRVTSTPTYSVEVGYGTSLSDVQSKLPSVSYTEGDYCMLTSLELTPSNWVIEDYDATVPGTYTATYTPKQLWYYLTAAGTYTRISGSNYPSLTATVTVLQATAKELSDVTYTQSETDAGITVTMKAEVNDNTPNDSTMYVEVDCLSDSGSKTIYMDLQAIETTVTDGYITGSVVLPMASAGHDYTYIVSAKLGHDDVVVDDTTTNVYCGNLTYEVIETKCPLNNVTLTLMDVNTEISSDYDLGSYRYGVTVPISVSQSCEWMNNMQIMYWEITTSDGKTLTFNDGTTYTRSIAPTIIMPNGAIGTNCDYTITAYCMPIVNDLSFTLDGTVEAGKPLPSLNLVTATISNTYYLDPDDFELIWVGGDTSGIAQYNTEYTAYIKIKNPDAVPAIHGTIYSPDSDEFSGYGLYFTGKFGMSSDVITVITDSEDTSVNGTMISGLESISAVFDIDKTRAPKVEDIGYIYEYNSISNGTAYTDLITYLQSEVEIALEDGSYETATIKWSTTAPSDYDPSELTSQTFTVTGTIVLPDTVDGSGIDLNVSTTVCVEAAPYVEAATSDKDTSIVYADDICVHLSTATEGATIYYSINGGSEKKYNSSKGITLSVPTSGGKLYTIRARVSKSGMRDVTTRFSYELNTTHQHSHPAANTKTVKNYTVLENEQHEFVCTVCGQTVQEPHNYNNKGICTYCGNDTDYEAMLKYASLSLAGNITLNVYVQSLTGDGINGGYLLIEPTDDDSVLTTKKVTFSSTNYDSSTGMYRISYVVPAKAVSDSLRMTIHRADGTTYDACNYNCESIDNGYIYSVKDYINAASNYGLEKLAELMDIVNGYTILYGKYEEYEDEKSASYWSEDQLEAVTLSTLKPYEKITTGTIPSGLTYSSITLVQKKKTHVRVIFKIASGADLSDYKFVANNTILTATTLSDSYIAVDLPALGAGDLDSTLSLLVSDGRNSCVIKVSALTYVYNMVKKYQGNSEMDAFVKLMKAMYLYAKAAEKYFDN